MKPNSTAKLVLFSTLLFIMVLSGCSRGDVPLPAFPTAEDVPISTEVEPTSTEPPPVSEKYPLQIEYAVVWASKADGLNVRTQAGISATAAKVIPWDSRQIYLTGNRSLLGSSLWLEITIDDGTTGWVSAWNLTEYVSSSQFCNDSRVLVLLEELRQAIQESDGASLQELMSPNRGLSLRLNWYNPDVIFPLEDVASIFDDAREIDWGTMADSGLDVTGSFEKIIKPILEDVFLNSSEAFCDELKWGNTAGDVLWPDELENLNFYTFYRPAKEGGNVLDWETWAVGIEYVNGQPFIAILVHYSSEL